MENVAKNNNNLDLKYLRKIHTNLVADSKSSLILARNIALSADKYKDRKLQKRALCNSLFNAHLAAEYLFKAVYVKNNKSEAPKTHKLQDIAKLSNLKFSEKDLLALQTITDFQISTRYRSPTANAKNLVDSITEKYTDRWLSKTQNLCDKTAQQAKILYLNYNENTLEKSQAEEKTKCK